MSRTVIRTPAGNDLYIEFAHGPYINGDSERVVLDGDFTLQELRILVLILEEGNSIDQVPDD